MMAMMMTGRVLLVCALCVLWCGAAVVAAADTGGVEMEGAEGSESLPSGPSDGDEGGKQESEGSVRQVSDTANESFVAVDGKNSKQQDGVVTTTPTKPERTDGGTETEEIKRKEQKENPEIPNKDDKTTQLTSRSEEKEETAPSPDEKEEPPAERGKTQGAALPGASPGVPSRAQNENSAENLTATPGEERVLPEDHSDQSQGGKTPADGLAAEMSSKEKGKAPEAPPSPLEKNEKPEGDLKATTNTEKNNLENLASVKKTESILEDKEATSNLQKEGLASTTGNQESDPSDGYAESTPTSISAASNAAKDDADTDTDKGIPNNDSAAGVAATEGRHQDENKEDNRKETTPLRSAAMINETATVGDSDGSTVVSHTTFPLLLLFVACAAAAAVVAA
ncbi:mucin-associated surface protein (MASP) [Trypanosoma cruzi]|uniref:Mucin-associated surface protein (MASP), putative n=2 Tax=Trypanosoma cruzi TaxID=5693 RepID=Q4D7K6_TRYCC|nr:mucin-associated surface protein (MASP), putative [Trypanosoma cruzi]EAN88507.1 mucin-associated surface protein (MASP), putative [Trypanosoma cruzi]RNC53090.1 mucin-associated surface protein (MASP) [Trypanosoma cruzi]|eukprot:XP_810358.1 mucin-associated surface protein (MASP) [Trypanosoma cruzi strain CL Brener]